MIRSYLKFLSQAAALFLGLTAIACLVPNLPDWAGLKYCFFLSIAFFVIRSAHKWWSQEKWEKRHKAYSIGLCEKDYLAWQQKFFDTLYSGLEIATLNGVKYPSAIIRPALTWEYPFDGLCKLTDVRLPILVEDRGQKNYRKLLGPTLRYPAMMGFALRQIVCNNIGNAEVIETVVANYGQNVVTSHILEWELYQFFNSKRKKRSLPEPTEAARILKQLPRRAAYHAGQTEVMDTVLAPPESVYPMLSLQAMVVYRDKTKNGHPWGIVTAKRSQTVVSKRGYVQFQPAGTFETYGTGNGCDDDESLLRDGFNVRMALFREYAEELFNQEHLDVRPDSRDARVAVMRNEFVEDLVRLIASSKASIDYLGIAIDLSSLRPEISFLIVVEDENYSVPGGCKEFYSIDTVSISGLPAFLANETLHGSSAALLQLAIESERLHKLGISEELTKSFCALKTAHSC